MLPWRDAALARRLRTRLGGATTSRAGRMLRAGTTGLIAHTTLRMLAIDGEVEDAVAGGTAQVVIVGAGLDTRAWRLPALAPARVFELDLPETQDAKRLRLGGRAPLAAEVHLVPCDLRRGELARVLAEAGHDPEAPSAWILEGVSMYLPLGTLRDALRAIGDRSRGGGRLLLTFAVTDLLGGSRPGRMLAPGARGVFRALGEPLQTLLDEDEVGDMLARTGYTDVEVTDSAHWARRAGLGVVRDALAAERLAVANRG